MSQTHRAGSIPGWTILVVAGLTGAAMHLPAHAAGALPQGGQFVAGTGAVGTATHSGTSSALTITQSSARGIVDWGSFSIGNGNSVTIQNGTGATLNRVTGTSRSLIDGALTGTGSIYLINPQGVVVGANGVITTGGRFVASSLDVDNTAFMQGGALTFSGTSNAQVVNLGRISSTGGDVFLIARNQVTNNGTISAPQGSVEMAAGQQILLQDSASSQQVFVQVGSQGTVTNQGPITAAQINLQAADGNVYALAGNNTTLRATGTATRDGHIWLVGGGTVATHAAVDALNADGTGGTVDMSAKHIDVSNSEVIAGQLNLTSPVFSVDEPTAFTLSRSLSKGTNVTVAGSGVGDTGDIGVGSSIVWSGNASLVFNAYRSLYVENNVTLANTGGGNLTLRADTTGRDITGLVTNVGTLDWSASTGIVSALYDMNGYYLPGTIRSNPSWSATPFSGLQTQVTAYQLVNSIADLNAVTSNLAGNYALGKDIGGASVAPVGAQGSLAFTGQFDGLGHTIDNVDIALTDPAATEIGLFATIGTTGVVRNLGLTNASISGYQGGLALLAGLNQGLLANVYSTGTVNAYGAPGNAGGLVVQNDGTITRAYSTASVGVFGYGGGLVAVNNGTVSQSYATGAVEGGSHMHGGGLVGRNNGDITQSYATGGVTGASAGGLVDTNLGTIEESFATGLVQPVNYPIVGGVAANNIGTIANNVFWDAQTTGQTAGGPVGNGLTTAQMSNAASFGPTWDFSAGGTWLLPTGAMHPVLAWQSTAP